jgi:hypothetical protein
VAQRQHGCVDRGEHQRPGPRGTTGDADVKQVKQVKQVRKASKASTEENISVQDREGRQVLTLLALLALLLHKYLLYWYKSRGEHPRPGPRGTLGTRAFLLYWYKSTDTDAAHPHPQSRYWDFYRSEQTQEEPYRQVLH